MKASLAATALALVLTSCAAREPSAPPRPPTEALAEPGAEAGGPSADGAPASRAPSGELSRLYTRTMRRVAILRRLDAKREVPGVVLPRRDLVAKIREKAERELPPDVLVREGEAMQLFGFAAPGFDYLAAMSQLLEGQLEGFYEPKSGTMYLARDAEGDEARATLAHELVHALQDHHWNLDKHSTYQRGKSDEQLAFAALAEGDATSLMIDFMMDGRGQTALDLPPQLLEALTRSMGESAAKGAVGVPHILSASLVAPYSEGLSFVNALRREGGWARVDAAWARPPVTTEQVLHPEKWASGEPALTVPAPTAKALGARTATREDDDDYGELGVRLLLAEWTGPEEAARLARGWGGDRSAVFRGSGTLATALHVRLDDGAQASARAVDVVTSLTRAWSRDGTTVRRLGKDGACVERPKLGPLLVKSRGRDWVLTVGPATMPEKGTGGAWASAATCAEALAWADEVLLQ